MKYKRKTYIDVVSTATFKDLQGHRVHAYVDSLRKPMDFRFRVVGLPSQAAIKFSIYKQAGAVAQK